MLLPRAFAASATDIVAHSGSGREPLAQRSKAQASFAAA